MNGVYTIPSLNLTKDQIVIYGVLLSIGFSILMTTMFKIDLIFIVGALIIYYIYKNGFNTDELVNVFKPAINTLGNTVNN